jgi:hypothetical protein
LGGHPFVLTCIQAAAERIHQRDTGASEMRLQKHIREAIRLSGVTPESITMNGGHYKLSVCGRTITAAGSPKDPTIASRNIATDLLKASGRKA